MPYFLKTDTEPKHIHYAKPAPDLRSGDLVYTFCGSRNDFCLSGYFIVGNIEHDKAYPIDSAMFPLLQPASLYHILSGENRFEDVNYGQIFEHESIFSPKHNNEFELRFMGNTNEQYQYYAIRQSIGDDGRCRFYLAHKTETQSEISFEGEFFAMSRMNCSLNVDHSMSEIQKIISLFPEACMGFTRGQYITNY